MGSKKLIIMCGEAFSGKSTLAKALAETLDLKIVGRDEIYFATEKILALENTPESDDESLWSALWPIVIQGVKNHLLLGNSVVVDDNCFYLFQRNDLRSVAELTGARSILIYLNTPAEILKERKEKNKVLKTRHDVPSAWMAEDTLDFERPMEGENSIIYNGGISMDEFVKNVESQF